MPTYPSPVLLPELQTYLKDASTDPLVLAFFQTCLDAATDYVYDWLDRDYTPLATKTDIFWGDDTRFYAPHHQVGSILSWTFTDFDGAVIVNSVGDLLIRSDGYLLQSKGDPFRSRG